MSDIIKDADDSGEGFKRIAGIGNPLTIPVEEELRDGPFVLSGLLYLQANEDPDKIAMAVFSHPPGRVLSFSEFQTIVDRIIEATNKEAGDGLTFKLLPRKEFYRMANHLPDKLDFTLPGSNMFTLDKVIGSA